MLPDKIDVMRPKTGILDSIKEALYLMQTKYDGTRTVLYKNGNNIQLIGRTWINDYKEQFPEIVKDSRSIRADNCILDTELTFFDKDNKDKFLTTLAKPETKEGLTARAMVFDLISLNNQSMMNIPIEDRLRKLREIIPEGLNHLQRVITYPASKELYSKIISLGYEGVVIKRRYSRYESGKTDTWLKIKGVTTEDCIVIGCTEGEGERSYTFGALILAQYDKNGNLRYVGKASGFKADELYDLETKMLKIKIDKCPIDYSKLPYLNVKMWCKPELIAEIRYGSRTDSGILRFPVFMRLREDKPLIDCKKE